MSLSREQVFDIKRRLQKGHGLTKISKDLEVPRSTIHDIKTGRTWSSVQLAGVKPKAGVHVQRIEEMKDVGNVLVVGDLHQPFTLHGYLDFCLRTKKRFKCKQVVFIGDIIDSHASSYHESDPDGMSAGDELKIAVDRLKPWYKAFPKALVVIGNHDRIIQRKAFSGGIPAQWLRDYPDVLRCPNWVFRERFVIDGVQYIHGDGGAVRGRAKKDLMSTVGGHWHTQTYVEHFVGERHKIFAMGTGCGVDRHSYAMAYAKHFGKPSIACSVVMDNGTLPINIMMEL